MLNWIVLNRTDFFYIKMDLALNNLQKLICHKIQPTNQLKLFIMMSIEELLCKIMNVCGGLVL